MTSETIECGSSISSVVVYARGAVVTRKIEMPAGLPSESVDLIIGGVTPLAEPGSVRTEVDGERMITGVRAPLVWPTQPEPQKPDEAAVKAKSRELRRIGQRKQRVEYRIKRLQAIGLDANLQAQKPRHDDPVVGINARLGAATDTHDLIHELLAKLDAELRELDRKVESVGHELYALQSVRPVTVSSQQHRQVRITLAPGGDHLRSLQITYNVSAARWWPAYAARLSNGGKQAEFAVEAFVAQNTLEDWKDASISLCTADMVSDLTLPELQSLRLGRKQPPPGTGFREPPEGLQALFKGHDDAFGGPSGTLPPKPRPSPMPPPPPMPASAPAPVDMIASQVEFKVGAAAPDEDYGDDDDMDSALYDEEIVEEPEMMRDEMAKEVMSRRSKGKAKKQASPSRARAGAAAASMLEGAPGFGGGGMPAPEPEEEVGGVDEQWLEYDSLELAPNHTDRRGRLAHSGGDRYAQAYDLFSAVNMLDAPGNASDPLYVRGMFDHRFDADGLVEISSSGVPQRVRLLTKAAKSRMAFRCVRLEDERVFREVEVENPLAAPLLPGPVDVFMDGALLITSRVEATDRGGTIRFGLGEEQRLRVARNVRAREESKGVFGGKVAMDHDVELEVSSALGGDILLELIDRLPVTDDKDIDVELKSSDPKAERYAQDERHKHVRGGLRWTLPVKAGATVPVKFSYRIGFDNDFELVGGNRRD